MKDNEIKGCRALAEALGKSVSTCHAYIRDPGWTFGPGPWSADDVPAIRSWIADNRQQRAGDDDGFDHRADQQDQLWERTRTGFYENLTPTPTALRKLADRAAVKPEFDSLPEPMVSAFERDVLAGKVIPTPAEVEAILKEFLLVRVSWLRLWNMIAPALAGWPAPVIGRRLRAVAAEMVINTHDEFQRLQDARVITDHAS